MREHKTKVCPDCGREFERVGGDRKRCWACAHVQTRIQTLVRSLVVSALKRGVLVRQPCEVCGNPKTDAHHDDYTRPLKVRWLCRSHHMLRHAELDEAVS